MASEASNPPSPSSSHSDEADASHPPSSLPEALSLGREKRATAGNKLRALLDAEFQEEEFFKEDVDDEEFERQKSDKEEEYLSSSESSDEDENEQDEEAGEKELIAEQKAASQKRKRKAEAFVKPPAKRHALVAPKAHGILTSRPTSTTSSVSNRRIWFDPTSLASRRSSRAITMQATNETQSRIISAAARRASLSAVPRREQTPPLTQEERLAQAVLTEKENKMSLKRIVEAEEERVKKRKEKLEALRRRHIHKPIVRFISRRTSLIQEIPDDNEEDVIIDDEDSGTPQVKEEGVDMPAPTEDSKDKGQKENGQISDAIKDTAEEVLANEKINVFEQSQEAMTSNDTVNETGVDSRDDILSQHNEQGDEIVNSPTKPKESAAEVAPTDIGDHEEKRQTELMQEANGIQGSSEPTTPTRDTTTGQVTMPDDNESQPPDRSPATPSKDPVLNATISSPRLVSPGKSGVTHPPTPKSPPPYHEAYYTTNTISFIPLSSQPLHSARETFFPSVPLVPTPKPKPSARCPITGLQARYKDPVSGVGYYDIHAFKILREVGRKGSRYVWCSEGGWFVGETGWGGRGAKGVPEGWNR